MTLTLELDAEQTTLVCDMRGWALEHVRPLAREADRLHAPPPGAEQALAACPIDVNPLVLADLPARREGDLVARPGGRGSHVLALMLMEEMSYGDVWPLSAMKGSGFTHKIVPMLGTPEQVDTWVGGVDRGELGGSAFALTEPQCGSDVSRLSTSATRTPDGWRLSGTKMYCSNGATADFIIVIARLGHDPASIRAFMVPRRLPGVHVLRANESKLGLRSTQTSMLMFENVDLPVDACLGFTPSGEDRGDARGLRGALTALSSSRPYMSAVAVGIARASLDVAAGWLADNRDEFGSAAFARRQEALADMTRRLDAVRLLTRKLGWLRDQGRQTRLEASMVKAYGPPLAERAIGVAIEVLGPDGCSEQGLVEKWYRDVKIFDIFEGTGQIQRITIARELHSRPSR